METRPQKNLPSENLSTEKLFHGSSFSKSVFSENLFSAPDAGARRLLDGLPALIDKTIPLPRQFRAGLKRDVAELSRLLTSGRGDRRDSYLGEPAMLSAYIRYFLPWNVYRLVRLLPNLPITLADGDAITDLGSGPLTLPIALWIARPDLRRVKLEFRCLDRTGPILEAGKKIFAAICGPSVPGTDAQAAHPWTIKTIRGELHERGHGKHRPGTLPMRGKPTALVTAVNVFNEVMSAVPPGGDLTPAAEREAALLSALAAPAASIFVVEPGVPRSGEFIAALRGALTALGRLVCVPCPAAHGDCSFPGGRSGSSGAKEKWCHFAFDTADAPRQLQALSAAAGIPKERAVLSFLFTGGIPALDTADSITVRIISDAFPLPGEGRFGRYGCSQRGAALVTGSAAQLESAGSGALLRLTAPAIERRDRKSGALILELRG
ncbi:hypothetical protein FACS189493_5230 [Spirochaetia bacterium]|nr:hypothetical protein FACS189493_5230 [Spirochaetia bacterium]